MKKLKEIKQKLGSTIEKAEIMRVSKPNVRRKKSADDFLSRGGSHDVGDNSSSGITEALDTNEQGVAEGLKFNGGIPDVDHMHGAIMSGGEGMRKVCPHCNGNRYSWTNYEKGKKPNHPWINPNTATLKSKQIPCPVCDGGRKKVAEDVGDNSSSGITEALDTYGDTQIEKINYQLDKVLNARFLFPELIITAIGAILERYSSVNLPALDASEVVDNHVIFHVDTYLGTPCFLFITINKDHHGHYEGFAQVVDEEQLMELMMIDHEVEDEEIPSYPSHFILQARHAADD